MIASPSIIIAHVIKSFLHAYVAYILQYLLLLRWKKETTYINYSSTGIFSTATVFFLIFEFPYFQKFQGISYTKQCLANAIFSYGEPITTWH